MNGESHATLVFAIGFAALTVMCCTCFLVWLLWSLFWDIYDHVTGHWKRIENREIDASYETHQFTVPPTMRDFK